MPAFGFGMVSAEILGIRATTSWQARRTCANSTITMAHPGSWSPTTRDRGAGTTTGFVHGRCPRRRWLTLRGSVPLSAGTPSRCRQWPSLPAGPIAVPAADLLCSEHRPRPHRRRGRAGAACAHHQRQRIRRPARERHLCDGWLVREVRFGRCYGRRADCSRGCGGPSVGRRSETLTAASEPVVRCA